MAKPSHQQRQLIVLIAFNDPRADPALLASHDVGLVEQHGLAHATQPVKYEAARESPRSKTLERDSEILELRIPSGEKRWPRSSPGRIWIGVPIHV